LFALLPTHKGQVTPVRDPLRAFVLGSALGSRLSALGSRLSWMYPLQGSTKHEARLRWAPGLRQGGRAASQLP
jgi:hypothetical protein